MSTRLGHGSASTARLLPHTAPIVYSPHTQIKQSNQHTMLTLGIASRDPVAAPNSAKLPVLFAIYQSGHRANGGVESVTQVIEQLRGVRPLVITQRETSTNERWRRAGAEVHVWSWEPHTENSPVIVRAVRRGAALLANNLRAYRFIRNTDVRVVHANDVRAFWRVALGAKAARARVLVNVRDTKTSDTAALSLKWRATFALADRRLVLSEEMAGAWKRLAERYREGRSLKIDYIYSIVDFEKMRALPTEERRCLREELGIGEREVALGYVASFNAKKNQLEFIRQAMPGLAASCPEATVYFVGDFRPTSDPYAQQCWEEVEALGLRDRVRFVGYDERIARWYQALDLVVLASRREGLARCMIESLATGTPVVSFAVCSASEVLERYRCGVVVPEGDYEAMVRAIGALAASSSKRAALGKRGADAARALFRADRVVGEYERLYKDMRERSLT